MAALAFSLFSTLTKSAPFILFDKKLDADSAKVGSPIHLIYNIQNFGDEPATDLVIDDNAIPREQFTCSENEKEIRFSELKPGQTITHAIEVTPKIEGTLRMSSSRLSYSYEGQRKIAVSSQIYFFNSESSRQIGAKYNIKGYGLVLAASAVVIFVPFLLWIATKKDQKVAAKGKAKAQ